MLNQTDRIPIYSAAQCVFISVYLCHLFFPSPFSLIFPLFFPFIPLHQNSLFNPSAVPYCAGDVVVVRLWETQSLFICSENCPLFLVALFLSQSRGGGSVNVKWYGICRKHKTNLLQQKVWDWEKETYETTPTDRSTVGSLVYIQS